MKIIGILILVAGLILGSYALTTNVGVDVPPRDFGYGIRTPAMQVANVDLMTQRQNYLIFSGILAVVGAILTGFASMRPAAPASTTDERSDPLPQLSVEPAPSATASSVSICGKCRHMGPGDAIECARCGTAIGV